ncbi:MAG: helix-turn-helix domain-containing protein [Ruminococcus sp.]|nr:helix-turn-helix domain-containing protein [Ruminococcus sp.]
MAEVYQMFTEYNDIISVDDVTKMLHLSKVTVYKLLQSGRIRTLKVGKKYIIPKKSVIDFLVA